MPQCLICACDLDSEFATVCEHCVRYYKSKKSMYKIKECHKCGEDIQVPTEWPDDQNMICGYCSGERPCEPEEDTELYPDI